MRIQLRLLIGLIIIMMAFTGCELKKEKEVVNQNTTGKSSITNEHISKKGIEADYPIITTENNSKDTTIWNQIIKKDFDKILDIYSFEPFPGLTPEPTSSNVILKVSYQIKLNNNNYSSFYYLADFNAPYSAHPTELSYTTNIDKRKNQRTILGDVVNLNEDFVKDFRNWDFISIEQGNAELDSAIKDYFKNITDEDLLRGLQNADIIGSGNVLDAYSYMTPEKLGISFGVPNYIGDHVEFERGYDKLGKYLKI